VKKPAAIASVDCGRIVVGPQLDGSPIMGSVSNVVHREPWNMGRIVGQKSPFKIKNIWALRVRLQMERR